jgi:hypothetical protein
MALSIWRRDETAFLKIMLISGVVYGTRQFFGAEIGTVILASLLGAGCFGMLFLGLMGRLK